MFGFIGSLSQEIARRANYYCEYCGIDLIGDSPVVPWLQDLDHIVPRCVGGRNMLENGALACKLCHSIKTRCFRESSGQPLVAQGQTREEKIRHIRSEIAASIIEERKRWEEELRRWRGEVEPSRQTKSDSWKELA
jgi:hypothetical protein